MHSFTSDDLIQFVYNEASIQKTAAIKVALETDWSLRDKYDEILSAHQSLGTKIFSPRQEVIDKILEYAEKSVNHLSHHI